MDASLFDHPPPCAGGEHTTHQAANAALKTLRYHAEAPWSADHDDSQGRGVHASIRDALPAASLLIDLTHHETIPVVPWQYMNEQGPHGQWHGHTFNWFWKSYLATLNRRLSLQMLGQDITRFVCRACPFNSPYPSTEGVVRHWEFTVFLADGKQVGLHPPGKKGNPFNWSAAPDEERAAALAAVAEEGAAAKVKACYFDTTRPRQYPQGPTHTQFPLADPRVLLRVQLRNAGVVVSTQAAITPAPAAAPANTDAAPAITPALAAAPANTAAAPAITDAAPANTDADTEAEATWSHNTFFSSLSSFRVSPASRCVRACEIQGYRLSSLK